jgi:hypothetical protein
MTNQSSIGLFLLAVLSSCNSKEANRAVSYEEAIEIADFYIDKNYPFIRREALEPQARDQGVSWIVTYRLPPGSVGGSPVVEIQKRDGKILHARHSQ